MSWRYDVHRCNNHSIEPGAHDRPCSGWRRVAEFPGNDWSQAYLLAERLPHGHVIRIWTGADLWGPGSTADVFEHKAGGGLCRGCSTRRGPMVSTYNGPAFLCGICVAGYRSSTLLREPNGDTIRYRRLIDEAIEHAAGDRSGRYTDVFAAVIAEVTR